MNNSLRRCQVHNRQSHSFCKTCKRVNCMRCTKCEEHERVGIDKLVRKHNTFLHTIYLDGYKANAGEASKTIGNKLTQTRNDKASEAKKAGELKKAIPNSKEGEANDLKLVGEAIKHLREIQEKAFTAILRETAEGAIHTLDIDDKIKEEISGYPATLEKHRENIMKLTNKIEKLKWKLEWLDTITNAESGVEEVELALSLCFANEIIASHDVSRKILDFRAFLSVDKVFDIESVEKQEFVDIEGGVRMSKPVGIGRELRKGGSYFHASISPNAIIAICSFNGTSEEYKTYKYIPGDRKYIIQFTDILSTRQVEMEVEDESLVGFFDNSMIVLTCDQPLREASVESVFDNPTFRKFKRVGSVDRVDCSTDVSLLHISRVLYYRDTSGIPYEYNVDTHFNTKIDIGKKVWMFANMTGIDVGVKGMFVEIEYGMYRYTYILNKNISITQIEGRQSEHLRVFLPSSTCPSDIEKGMLKYDDYFIFNKRKIQPTTPIKFEANQSLIRIYKDIFLAYDMNTHQWVLIRIVVP